MFAVTLSSPHHLLQLPHGDGRLLHDRRLPGRGIRQVSRLFNLCNLDNICQSNRTGIALCGKLFAAGNFSVVYMYTAEIYPTVVRSAAELSLSVPISWSPCRQTAIGWCSSVARIGGIAAPYIALYLPDIQQQLPMLILGGSSLIGGLLSFALPETLGHSLPEKVDDIRKLKENGKPLCTCVNPKTMDI